MVMVMRHLTLLIAVSAVLSLQVQEQVNAQGVETVKVRWDSGAVKVVGGADHVHATSSAAGLEAAMSFEYTQDVEILTLKMNCALPLPCRGDLELHVPDGISVEVDLSDGDVELVGELGDLSILVGRGDITGVALTSEDSVLQVVNGSIISSWSSAPRRVIVASVRGDVELRVPRALYKIDDLAGKSSVYGLETGPDAERTIRVTALGGDTNIYGISALASR